MALVSMQAPTGHFISGQARSWTSPAPTEKSRWIGASTRVSMLGATVN